MLFSLVMYVCIYDVYIAVHIIILGVINAWCMRTRVTVLTLCISVFVKVVPNERGRRASISLA